MENYGDSFQDFNWDDLISYIPNKKVEDWLSSCEEGKEFEIFQKEKSDVLLIPSPINDHLQKPRALAKKSSDLKVTTSSPQTDNDCLERFGIPGSSRLGSHEKSFEKRQPKYSISLVQKAMLEEADRQQRDFWRQVNESNYPWRLNKSGVAFKVNKSGAAWLDQTLRIFSVSKRTKKLFKYIFPTATCYCHGDDTQDKCSSNETSIQTFNFHPYGDQNLDGKMIKSISRSCMEEVKDAVQLVRKELRTMSSETLVAEQGDANIKGFEVGTQTDQQKPNELELLVDEKLEECSTKTQLSKLKLSAESSNEEIRRVSSFLRKRTPKAKLKTIFTLHQSNKPNVKVEVPEEPQSCCQNLSRRFYNFWETQVGNRIHNSEWMPGCTCFRRFNQVDPQHVENVANISSNTNPAPPVETVNHNTTVEEIPRLAMNFRRFPHLFRKSGKNVSSSLGVALDSEQATRAYRGNVYRDNCRRSYLLHPLLVGQNGRDSQSEWQVSRTYRDCQRHPMHTQGDQNRCHHVQRFKCHLQNCH